MTSRPTILIAPHRPALGSTTRSPPITCCLDDLSCCLHLPPEWSELLVGGIPSPLLSLGCQQRPLSICTANRGS